MGDKHVSFHAARDMNLIVNEVAAGFPEVAKALERLDPKVLRDFSNALSNRMLWPMAEMFTQAANGLNMDVLEGFVNTAHVVDSRRLDDFTRAVNYLESDPTLSDLGRVVDDMREALSLIAEAKRGLTETKNALASLDTVTLAESYRQQEQYRERQHSAAVKRLEQEVREWKLRCLYAVGAVVLLVSPFLR